MPDKIILAELKKISERLEQLEAESKSQGEIARTMHGHLWILERLGSMMKSISDGCTTSVIQNAGYFITDENES